MVNLIKVCGLIFILYGLICCGSGDSPQTNKKLTFTSEKPGAALTDTTRLWPSNDSYTIDLGSHVISADSGAMEIDAFPVNVKTNATTTLPKKVHTISGADFCALEADARQIISETGCTTAFTAVRIWFGMNTAHEKIEPVYEPVALCHVATAGQTDTFRLRTAATPTYYVHNGGSFSTVSGTTAASVYQQYTLIKRSAGAGFSSFNPGTDVRSILFSFQEIGELIHDNGADSVTVWNAITKMNAGGGNSLQFHTLLMAPSDMDTGNTNSSGQFHLKYANLAHLCPDNCEYMVFARKD